MDSPGADGSTIPEERILLAAIACINEDGLAGATVRRIAERAGVNPAAISYYYRGKDRLLELAMETTLKNAFNLADFSDSADYPPRERLASILDQLAAGALAYPGVSRAHFFEPFMHGRYDVPAVRRIDEFLEELLADLTGRYRAAGREVDGDALRRSLIAAMSATMLYASTMPDLFTAVGGPEFRNGERRRSYIEETVGRLLP